MTIGVIGLGSIGERHVRNIQKLYPNTCIDILTKRTIWRDASKNTHLIASPARFYTTKHDVYFITNETGKHGTTILRCIQQKPKGIFVEKPLTHSLHDIARIKKALSKTDTVFFVAYCLQFFKPLLTIKETIEGGGIGKILSMRVSVGKNLRTWKAGDYRKRYSTDSKRGGGVILDLVHELNYPAWLLKEPLQFITGFSGRVSLPIKAEDISEGIFRTKKGVVVSVHQDYLQTPGRRYCEIIGTKGTLIWEDDAGTISIRTASRTWTHKVREERNEMYKRELVWFITQVRARNGYSNFDEAAKDVENALALKNI